jgi:CheY-like chemotaxis protein
MMKLGHLDLVFPLGYLKATLMISLLTVWVLVGLFYYLNRYTRRDYFAIWTAGWVFYALWLTASVNFGNAPLDSATFMLKQCCVSLSAAFMLWGSLRFLGLPVRQSLFGMFMLFLLAWNVVSPQMITSSLQIQMPTFILLGSSSLFAGFCFFRLRRQKVFVGAGMLSLGFLLWGVYLGTYPLSLQYENLYSAGFFASAVLQLFIAVSMIVLVLEEVRDNTVPKDRLQAAGQIALGIAHDVNNALCPIISYTELLLNKLPDLEDEPRRYLRQIHQAAAQVAQIVTRTHQCGRLELEVDPSGKVKTAPPFDHEAETERMPPPPGSHYQPCRPLRILCIDDEPALRQVLSNILSLHNHKVTVAASAREGLEMFRSNLRGTEPYEVVITDLGMPEMDGRQVARALRADSPKIPIVMLTGWGATMKADGEFVPEVDAVLGKPPHLQELNNLLIHVTAKRN